MCDFFWHWEEVSLDNQWGRGALIVYMLLSMLCIYFVGLGLVAELAVKASGMHARRARRVIPSRMEPATR